jgi:hypothetical protein
MSWFCMGYGAIKPHVDQRQAHAKAMIREHEPLMLTRGIARPVDGFAWFVSTARTPARQRRRTDSAQRTIMIGFQAWILEELTTADYWRRICILVGHLRRLSSVSCVKFPGFFAEITNPRILSEGCGSTLRKSRLQDFYTLRHCSAKFSSIGRLSSGMGGAHHA